MQTNAKEYTIPAMDEVLTCIKNLTDRHTVVSFDIWDTLLLRSVVHPHDLFGLIEYSCKAPGFRRERIVAEAAAIKYFNNENVNLAQIYSVMPAQFAACKQREIDTEIATCRANELMLRAFNYAREQGRRIIIISDMYLPDEVLARALERCGFTGYERLYVSAQCGARKSTGALYDHVATDLGVNPSDIVHFGDNVHSDYSQAVKHGFDAYATPVVFDLFAKSPENRKLISALRATGDFSPASMWAGMAMVRWWTAQVRGIEEDLWSWTGYSVMGPLIYGYCNCISLNLAEFLPPPAARQGTAATRSICCSSCATGIC